MQTFQIVDSLSAPNPDEALASLMEAGPRRGLHDHQDGASTYQPSPELETAINMVLAVGAPLLLTGEPGTGKTQAAWYIGRYFGIAVRQFNVRSTSTSRELMYDFDTVGYLREATHPSEPPKARREFLSPGVLWQAYEDPRPSVLLIDEIDKAPRDFPNDLLHVLDQQRFTHPFDVVGEGEGQRPKEVRPGTRPPVVVITSNSERRLPDAFLRRCIYHHIELSYSLIETVVRVRAESFPRLTPEVQRAAIDRFWEIRELELRKRPSTAELLVWMALLSAQRVRAVDVREAPLSDLPALGALLKLREDLIEVSER